jgi:hypothetical protein
VGVEGGERLADDWVPSPAYGARMSDPEPPSPPHTHEIGCPEYQPDRGDCAPMLHPPWSRAYYQCLQCDELWSGTVGPADCPQCRPVHLCAVSEPMIRVSGRVALLRPEVLKDWEARGKTSKATIIQL